MSFTFPELTTVPGAPATGYVTMYAKTDGNMYSKDDAGTESQVSVANPLTVATGGTGVATLADAGVLIGNGTGVVQVTGAGTSGQVLTSNGAGVDPTFQTGAFTAASQAQMEAATDNTVTVTPLSANWHPGVAKVWCNAIGAGTGINASWNMTSVTDVGTGDITFTIATDFSGTNWVGITQGIGTAAHNNNTVEFAKTAGAISARFAAAGADPDTWAFVGFGDQA